MPITRTFERNGKPVVVTLADPTSAIALLAFARACQARIRAGDRAHPVDVPKLVRALRRKLIWPHVAVAFTADEMPALVELVLRDKHPDPDLLRVVVTPELVELYVAYQERQKYLHTRLTAPLSAAAKKPEAKAIIVKALRGRTIANPELAKAIARLLARLGAPAKPAPVAPAASAGKEAALLAAIAEEPASNAPRLVYADWLLEQGDPWGTCIHAACKRPEGHIASNAERRHATRFLAPIRPFIRHFDFERGLLSRVRADAKQFLKAAVAIAERAPRAALELVDVAPGDVPALARAPLGRFASVSFERARIDDAGAATLARSTALAGLEELRLERNRMTDTGMRALASSPHLRSLRILSLTNAKAPASVDTLALLLAFPALEQLDIECTGTGLGRVIAACTAPLDCLYLDAPSLGDADIDAIARAWKRKSRFWLRLGDHDLSPRGMTVYNRLVDAFAPEEAS